ncbi:hypothetical protein R75465_08264 [Paraburkholderia aspalathi]|nr:hypothetical protein R75465_08264 [Paraburkholderia aspalathi]
MPSVSLTLPPFETASAPAPASPTVRLPLLAQVEPLPATVTVPPSTFALDPPSVPVIARRPPVTLVVPVKPLELPVRLVLPAIWLSVPLPVMAGANV